MGILRKLFGGEDDGPKPCRVEVWHVTVAPPAYFVARCDCEWLGACFDEPGPAFEEARGHSAIVEPEVVEI